MLRDLLDVLRCPADHEETWLVAMVHRADGPALRDATLSCPHCGAVYAVREGVADFGGMPSFAPHVAARADIAAPSERGAVPASEALAAWLGVTGGLAPLVLVGTCVAAGPGIAALVEAPQLWINAADHAIDAPAASISRLTAPHRAPLGAGTAAAVAVDAVHAGHTAMFASLLRAVRQGGRLVAPAWATLPPGVTRIAHDADWQVADVTAPARGLVTLRRRPPDV